jgi:hypothetical protein
MQELDKIAKKVALDLGVEFYYYREDFRPTNIPVCDRQFEGIADDGTHVFFRFVFKRFGYVGVLKGEVEQAKKYAVMLPAYLESFAERDFELSKTEFLKRILLGECSSASLQKFETKFSVASSACFVLAIRIPKMTDEAISLIAQYGGNSLDTVVKMDENNCALVRFLGVEDDYHSALDYADFLSQSLKEELGIDVTVGVGTTVKGLKYAAASSLPARSAAAIKTSLFFMILPPFSNGG